MLFWLYFLSVMRKAPSSFWIPNSPFPLPGATLFYHPIFHLEWNMDGIWRVGRVRVVSRPFPLPLPNMDCFSATFTYLYHLQTHTSLFHHNCPSICPPFLATVHHPYRPTVLDHLDSGKWLVFIAFDLRRYPITWAWMWWSCDEQAERGLEQPSESNPNGDNDFDMFCDLEIDDDFPIETTPDETNLLNQCQVEMEAYLADQGIKLRIRKEHNKKKYNDPLDWSKQHENKYPIVLQGRQRNSCAFLPVRLHAPSELIWSGAGFHK